MIEVLPDPDALAAGAARHIAAVAEQSVAARGRFVVALAGGSTPRATYGRLATGPSGVRIDWRRTHAFWSDERCVPPDDPRSNYRMARETLLERVSIPAGQVHRIQGEADPDTAATAYERVLRAQLDDGGLDLVLLGLGQDGHTASLFPGGAAVRERVRWVVATEHPDGDAIRRVTLTPVIINAARHVCFIVSGGGKAERLRDAIEGSSPPERLPARAVRPRGGSLTWLVDAPAASRLAV